MYAAFVGISHANMVPTGSIVGRSTASEGIRAEGQRWIQDFFQDHQVSKAPARTNGTSNTPPMSP